MSIFSLLIAFQIKQFLCDYPLQTQYTLLKFRVTGWFAPLLLHASVHAMGSALIVSYANVDLIWLALVDLVAHFIIDRAKARFGEKDLAKNSFWWGLGVDQMAHHLTHYAIIYYVVTHS